MIWKMTENLDAAHWSDLEKQFSFVAEMAAVPQDPRWHAEGDVGTHTRMVLAALEGLPEFAALDAQAQQVLRAAALLHDVEKRSTTIIHPDGRIESPGHARKGEPSSRWILYHDLPAPFALREEIAHLVRRHGLPLWAMEKPNPRRAVIMASLECNTHLLYLLARADVLGRICDDQQELLERCEFFRELCIEAGCYGKPYPFADGHSRFTWGREETQWEGQQRFDETHSEVIMLCGLPGAGKDTWIRKNVDKDVPVISLDALRDELDLVAGDASDTGKVLSAAREQCKVYLRKKQPFVWNSTNIVSPLRNQLVNLLTEYNARVRIVYLEVPWLTLTEQNRNREARVPANVMMRFARKLDPPGIWEAQKVEYVC